MMGFLLLPLGSLMKKYILILMLVTLPLPSLAQPQPAPSYLKAVTFHVSVDDWADVWINDIPIVDSQPYTSSGKGPQAIAALPKSLCYFQRENILAIEVSDKAVSVMEPGDSVGIAYILQMVFSDGRELLLTSDDSRDHTSHYIADRFAGEPRDWHKMTFNDEYWQKAYNTGPSIPYAALLNNPQTNQPVSFLSASSNSSRAQVGGERHLFRRKFFLNIGDNPNCGSPAPRIEPLVVSQPDIRHPVKIPTPTPIPPPTPTPWVIKAPVMTPTPVRVNLPPPARPKIKTRFWNTFTPTPTFRLIPLVKPKPVYKAPVMEPSVNQVIPSTPTLSFVPPEAEPQTIVFDTPPANIYMSFADGPGVYRLEVFDESGRHFKNLFERKIVATEEAWAVWDGKNDQGAEAPPGRYFVIFSKDGKVLKNIFVTRTPFKQ